MNNSNLALALKKLSPRELKKLEEMLHSPYFNKNERCIILYQLIKKEVLEKEQHLDKDLVFKIIFPHKKKKDTALSVLMSKLLDFVQEVVVLEQLRLRPHTWNYLLLKGLGEKGDGKNIQQLGNKSLKKLQSNQRWTREDYQNNYLITNLLYELEVTTQRHRKLQPEKVIEALDDFYLSHRLPLTYEMMNVQQMLAANTDNYMINKLLEMSQDLSMENKHLIRLYRLSVLLIKESKELKHFEKLLVDLETDAAFIPREDLHSLYAMCCNFCIQQIISGNRNFYERMFEIYNKMIAQKALFITKYIHPGQIKNVVTLSCQLGRLEWAHSFLEEYSRHLDPNIRQLHYNYYRATIFFYQKDFENARELLVQTESMEVFFEIGRKFFLLKIYYELGEDLALDSWLDAFKSFVRSNKSFSSSLKTSYLNFAKMLGLLMNTRMNKSPKKIKALQKKLNAYQQISDKKWLVEKLGEL